MLSPVRAGLDEMRELGTLLSRKTRRRTLRPAVQKTLGTMLVEAVDPVAKRLPVHTADPGRFRPVQAVQNRSQREQPTALARVPRRRREPPQLGCRIILS